MSTWEKAIEDIAKRSNPPRAPRRNVGWRNLMGGRATGGKIGMMQELSSGEN
jgi:hypothetical protein